MLSDRNPVRAFTKKRKLFRNEIRNCDYLAFDWEFSCFCKARFVTTARWILFSSKILYRTTKLRMRSIAFMYDDVKKSKMTAV